MKQEWREVTEEILKGLREGTLRRCNNGRIRKVKVYVPKPRPPLVPDRLQGLPVNKTLDCDGCQHFKRGDDVPNWVMLRSRFSGCRSWRRKLTKYDGPICTWGKYFKTIEDNRHPVICYKLRKKR